MTAFEEMGMLPELGKSVDELEWNLPTDVQAEAIPLILGGGDVLMAAETGSGKTGAFCLPCLQVVWETMKDIQSGKTGSSGKTDHSFNHWALNMYDRSDAMAIASDGLLCQSRDQGGWHGCRGTKGVRGSGKYYYESIVSDEGLCRVGWSTLHAKLDLGTCHDGFGFGGTGKKSTNKQFDSYGESFGLQDVIGCYLDLDNFQIRFSKNSTLFPIAFNIPKSLNNEDFFPAVVLKNAEMKFNFGTEPFKFPPTDGFIALCEASKENATDSTIHGQSQAVASKPKPNAPMCIVIEPSRELAEQTYNQFEKFKSHLANPKIRNLLVVGGVPAREQIEALRQGIDIVTGTPGRIDEFISSGEMCLSQVRFFVLDEADGLLAQNCLDLIKRMHSKIPKVTPDGKRLQMIVCSATLHNFDVKKMANSLMHFPVWVDLKGQDSVPETVHHVVAMIDPRVDKRWINAKAQVRTDGVHARDQIRPGSDAAETLSEAVKLLKGEYVVRAIREHKMDQALIFCRTKIDCDNMERWLKQVGGNDFSCVCLHGDRPPKERKANLESFKKASVKFLICTDVAARGLDIAGVPYVINVTLPDDKANYTHRIGRVGRAERMGLAISLVSAVPEKVWYHGCPSRGKSCNDTRLTEEGGCTIWYNEPRYLADIEEHLGVTIQQIESDLKVEADEFDGKVVYGQKKKDLGSGYVGHASYLASTVKELAELEKSAQTAYLHLLNKKDWKIR